MKKVELFPGIHSSVIGFGCAPVLGAADAKTAKYALDFAIENGVNHLDVARSYGFGEAEGFVEKIIKGKRGEIVLASKFGIKPNWKASLLNSLKPVIRMIRKPKKQENAPTDAPAAHSSNFADNFLERIVPLRGSDMRKSLEKSLKELGTDHLDYFFIHEPLQTLTYISELQETAEKLKAEGKIRAWGLAYMQSQQPLHRAYLNSFDLLQFNKPAELVDYSKLVLERGQLHNIIFSPIRGGNPAMKPNEKLQLLFKDFPNSVVLCSMFNLNHLKQNIELAG